MITIHLQAMQKRVLFFHGGARQEDYEADEKLVASLQSDLGVGYRIHYPLPPEGEVSDFGRREQIGLEM